MRRPAWLLSSLLLFALPVEGALSCSNRTQCGNTAASTTLGCTFGSATAAGSLLILRTTAAGSTHNTPTDGASNGWVQADSGPNNINGGNWASIWYVKNATANAGTVTMNYGGSYIYRSAVLLECSGADTSSPLIATKGGTAGATNTATTGTFTISQESVIASITIGTPAITSGGSGWTATNFAITGDATAYFFDQHKIVSADEAAVSVDTATGSGIYGSSFKVAAAGGTTGKNGTNCLLLRVCDTR